jgi:DNA-binding NarL/FixJ family response regulator
MRDESLFAERAIATGAHGYINKHEVTTRIIEALHRVLDGKIYLSSQMVERHRLFFVPESIANRFGHQRTQQSRIRSLLAHRPGAFDGEIAEHMHLSAKTVETHREKIKRKLGLTSAGELMRHARAMGFGAEVISITGLILTAALRSIRKGIQPYMLAEGVVPVRIK